MKRILKNFLITSLSIILLLALFPALKVEAANTDIGTYTLDLSSGNIVIIPGSDYLPYFGGFLHHVGITWIIPNLPSYGNHPDTDSYYAYLDLDYNGTDDVCLLYHSGNNYTEASVLSTNSCSGTYEYNYANALYPIDPNENVSYYSTVRIILPESSGTDNYNPYGKSLDNLVNDINNGSGTIIYTSGSALPKRVMKALANNPNATLNFIFEQDGVKYDILIPGKEFAKYYDESIEWYGHLWLKAHFGNRAK